MKFDMQWLKLDYLLGNRLACTVTDVFFRCYSDLWVLHGSGRSFVVMPMFAVYCVPLLSMTSTFSGVF